MADRDNTKHERLVIYAYMLLKRYHRSGAHERLKLNKEMLVVIQALHNAAESCLLQQNLDDTLGALTLALSVARACGALEKESFMLYKISTVYLGSGNFTDALNYSLQALKIARKVRNQKAEGVLLYMVGDAYLGMGRCEEAMEHFQSGLKIARKVGDGKCEGRILSGIGRVYVDLGRYGEALDYLQQGLQIAIEESDRPSEGTTLNAIGLAYKGLRQFKEALDYLIKGLKIVQEVDWRETAVTLRQIGLVYAVLWQFEEAIDNLQEALKIVREARCVADESSVLGDIGTVYRMWGRYEQALDFFKRSLKIVREIGDRTMEGRRLKDIGEVYLEWYKFSEALDYLRDALKIAQEVMDHSSEGTVRHFIGLVYWRCGRFSEALDYFQQAREISRKVGNRIQEGVMLHYIGLVYREWCRYGEALDYFRQALVIAREVGNVADESSVLGDIGTVYHAWGRYEQALDFFKRSLKIIQEAGHRPSEGPTLNAIALVYVDLGRYGEALDYLQQGLKVVQETGFGSHKVFMVGNIGTIHLELGSFSKALEYFKEALKIAQEAKDRFDESNMLYSIGSVYGELGKAQKAFEHFGKALEIARDVGDRTGEAKTLSSIGLMKGVDGKFVEGFEVLKDAIDIYEVLVGETRSEVIRQTFRATTLEVYNVVVHFLIKWYLTGGEGVDTPAKLLVDAVRFLEMGKAREVVDKLEPGKPRKDLLKICPEMQKIVEEEQYLTDQVLELEHRDATERQALAAAQASGSDIASLEALQSKSKVELEKQRSKLKEKRQKILEQCADPGLVRPTSSYDPIPSFKEIFNYCPDAIIWEFFFDQKLVADKFWILAWSQEGIARSQSNSFDLEKATTCLQQFHKRLEQAVKEPQKQQVHIEEANKQLAKLSQLLGNMLPEELWQTLEGKELLILIPHERLHLFPWGIAKKPSPKTTKGRNAKNVSNPYLGLQVPIVRSYSLGLVVSCLKRDKTLPPKFLLVANPTGDLRGPDREMASIEVLLASLALKHKDLGKLRHKQATKDSFVEKVKEAPSVIHFAGHGVFDGEDPWLSCLKFYDAKGHSSYTVTDMLLNRFPGSPLFVLSACETARGVISRGDEAMGILRGLTLAGATSILATNWLLTDMVAPYFMRNFYKYFFQEQSAAQALFNARLELFENHHEFREPLFWAVYELYGNPFKQLKLEANRR